MLASWSLSMAQAVRAVTLPALLGTGVFLTLRMGFLPWRNLFPALKLLTRRESRSAGRGRVSPLSTLMTALAATIGTGNIVGVATAITAGGPGALVWMEIAALFGLSAKFAECALAVKFRRPGEVSGGPMYTMARGIRPRLLGRGLAALFACFAVLASFGIGDVTQSNSIAAALRQAFSLPPVLVGFVTAALTLIIIRGGIRRIAGAASVLVPVMAGGYLLAGLAVIAVHWQSVPAALVEMLSQALSPAAVAGGAAGTALRWGVARGIFSNEAGMGSAAITAASAGGSPALQGYIHMTGVFFDTIVVCTVTGLAICCSGVLGAADPATGLPAEGAVLTILAFETVLGSAGRIFLAAAIVLFAFSSMLGWAYQGETALVYLAGRRTVPLYRCLFAAAAWAGAFLDVEAAFGLSDLFNCLMALPNLACLLLLSGAAAREMKAFQPELHREKRRKPVNFL